MNKRLYLLFFSLLFITIQSHTIKPLTTSVEGKITDAVTNEGLIAAEVILYKNDVFIIGTTTDFDGNYALTGLQPGIYDVEASYLGYQAIRHNGVVLYSGKTNKVNIGLSQGGLILEEVVVKAYKAPLVEQDNTTQRKINTREQIRSLPTKSITAIASTSAGIRTSDGDANVSIRGCRGNASNFYVDGIRVAESSISNYESPQSEVHEKRRPHYPEHRRKREINREQYGSFIENSFVDPLDEGLSTFSIDVDRAGYSNVRRFLDDGQMPPTDAVRIEEMINYFNYDYDQPKGKDPIALYSTLTDCPWNKDHRLMHIGLQGKEIVTDELPPSNLVFLIDVSGSMNRVNKLPLLKSSFKMLINNLRDEDRVAIVTYAGSAGVALKSTPASDKTKILQVVNSLGAGGSTAGAEGILTAYKIARENFMEEGNNRIILATDGDFNVGINSNDDLQKLIEKERKSGVFLSVLGFGMGNYKDEKMQTLADKGNGNHAYIDNIQEARKVLISEFGGTLFTIAKDVKLQIEFNPAHVLSYRLVGYENRLLNKEDFNDDTKDAGEMGSGHVVTAIYEVVPVGSGSSIIGNVDPLKYQKNKPRPTATKNNELATIKFRYKTPQGSKSKMIESVISPKVTELGVTNFDVQFSIAVAEFGMILRDSKYVNTGNIKEVISLAEKSKGKDDEGYRAEFVRLAKSVNDMQSSLAGKE